MKIFIVGDIKEKNKYEAPVLVGDDLFNSLIKSNKDVYYLTYFKEGYRYSRKEKLFGYEQINEQVVKAGIFPLLKYIIKSKPEIIHFINVEFFYLVFYLLKPFLGFKVIYTVHGLVGYEQKHFRNLPVKFRLKSRFIEWVNFRLADQIIFLSDKTSKMVPGINKKRKAVLNNGIHNEPIRKNYCEEADKKITDIAFVVNEYSEERKEKGLDILINYLQNQESNFTINFYGSREEKITKFNNVQVNYHKFMDNEILSGEMLRNDIFVAPSRYDTFNLSLLKAMDIGMLFLCSDRVGLSERFDNTLMKFVYRYNDSEDFTEKINYLKTLTPLQKEEYSEYIKNFAQKFSWDKVVNEYYDLYISLLK